MKHTPDIKILKRFIGQDPLRKINIAQEFKLASTDAIDKWIERRRLPRVRRASILKFIKENMK